ncbi:MAG: hypothetical protein LBJ32_02735 [Oscillospiraceae bacterium]|jgi:energy-converting hydrogenase Eha subunit H|nr:hypothetical protein [Oscillospiraceae bacterium]
MVIRFKAFLMTILMIVFAYKAPLKVFVQDPNCNAQEKLKKNNLTKINRILRFVSAIVSAGAFIGLMLSSYRAEYAFVTAVSVIIHNLLNCFVT